MRRTGFFLPILAIYLFLSAISAVFSQSAGPQTTNKPVLASAADAGVAVSLTDVPYDPIQMNGVYFEGWETPQTALILTGLLNGYIEPCGCAGMERMKGGLSRRHTFFRELADKGWPLASVDTGLITNGFGVQEELKFDMAVNAFRLMNYDMIGISANELRFPADVLLTYTVPSSLDEQSLFASANVGVYGFNDIYTLPFKTFERGGIKFGATSVVFADQTANRDENIFVESPEKKLRAVLPRLLEKNCDHLILIVHGSEEQTLQLADQFREFDIILTGDSPADPPAVPKTTPAGQYMIEVGEKGKFAVVLGFYEGEEKPRYQRVALDSRFGRSDDVYRLMEGYQEILKGILTTKGYKGLGLGQIDSPQRAALGEFVGSKKCESCHEESYRTWRKNKHSSAWASLATDPPTVDSADPPRDFDPECVSCHVIGWQSRENFPYTGGFLDMKQTPHLADVGCESCHGPGSKHLAAEIGDNEKLQETIRAEMRLGDRAEKVCQTCHDEDNSPDFDFKSYYKIIEHYDTPPDEADNEADSL